MKNNTNRPSTTSSHIRKTLVTALLLAGITQTDITHAAAVGTGDVLTITAGVTAGTYGFVTGGSYFVCDCNGDGKFQVAERTALQQGTQGLVIGSVQATGTSHAGAPTGTEGGTIDAAWSFFGNTSMHFTASPVTGSTTAGLDFSGWRMTWDGITINLGGGLQNCGTTSDGICVTGTTDIGGTYNNGTGIASFSWSGVYGTGYTLDYTARIPAGDPSGFGLVLSGVHLVGTVQAAVVPIPAAVWLFGSGLMGLIGLVRRRKVHMPDAV